jgi:YbbR domain-containing protein
MPFQDVEDVTTTEYSGSPGVVESWLRKVFIEDWGLKLLALGITLLLWMAVTGANKTVTIRRGVQLNFIRPDKLEIGNDPPRTVDVLLTGRKDKLASIGDLDLVATVDVSDQREGERVVRLSSDRVQTQLPDGVRIETFQPGTIPVRLEPVVERRVGVEIKLEGKPADGYEVYSVHSSPESIMVRGPAGHVNVLQKALTETISIAEKNQSFSVGHIAIDIPDHKVDLLDSAVDINVEIGERRVEKTFAGVPVTVDQRGTANPKTTTVTVFGPASVIAQLKAEDVKIVLVSTSTGSMEPHLNLPPGVQDRLVIRSIKPSQFSVAQ